MNGNESYDILYQAALVWKELMEYRYEITYGYKRKLYYININFYPEDFPHIAGFQYLGDVRILKATHKKMFERILDKTINFGHIIKGSKYEQMVKPRLEAIIQLKNILENEINLFTYYPQKYPFLTKLSANYLISSYIYSVSFVFLKQISNNSNQNEYICSSAFIKGERDYEINQYSRTVLKNVRVHIPTNTTVILFDRISAV